MLEGGRMRLCLGLLGVRLGPLEDEDGGKLVVSEELVVRVGGGNGHRQGGRREWAL